ncbi:MAG: hypothetical protein NWE76_05375 [Candidatus Bathyarchaeota archaeon]|nr:hypothetical protein [Candidatus Bathyarchaeota archaeon]
MRFEKRAARAIQRRVEGLPYTEALGAVRDVLREDSEEINRRKSEGSGTLDAVIDTVMGNFEFIEKDSDE